MAQVDESTLTAIGAALAKLAPGILGSLISLRALPMGATWGDRFTAFVGGVGASMYVGPALTEWAGISSARIEAGIGFAVGEREQRESSRSGHQRDALRRARRGTEIRDVRDGPGNRIG